MYQNGSFMKRHSPLEVSKGIVDSSKVLQDDCLLMFVGVRCSTERESKLKASGCFGEFMALCVGQTKFIVQPSCSIKHIN
jgi:hypothetical protein